VEALPDDAQVVVSEPLELHSSHGRWAEVPEGSVLVLRRGEATQSAALADVSGSPAAAPR
jgi:glutamine amidotransferase